MNVLNGPVWDTRIENTGFISQDTRVKGEFLSSPSRPVVKVLLYEAGARKGSPAGSLGGAGFMISWDTQQIHHVKSTANLLWFHNH